MNEPLSQREYAKKLYGKICDKLGVGEIPIYRFPFPEDSPVKRRTMEGLKSGEFEAISITRLNATCEHFGFPKPKFFDNL